MPPAHANRSLSSRSARFLALCASVLAAWTLLAAALTLNAGPGDGAVVFGTPRHTLRLLEGTDIRILTLGEGYLVMRGTEPGFVRKLYAHGALLVLPARAGGCLELRAPAS